MLASEARNYPTTTHEVTNQSGALTGVNVFDQDTVLRETVAREGAGWVAERAARLGRVVGDPIWQEHAHLANQNGPRFKSHDRFGHRIDLVEFHPSYHALMELAFGSGVHSLGWNVRSPAMLPP